MQVVLWALLAISVAASFVFQTAVVTHHDTPALLAGLAVSAFAFLGVLGGVPRVKDLTGLGVRSGSLVLLAGVLGVAVAPALVMANRSTDVPPGAVVAFWTTTVWGGLLVLAAALMLRRPTWAAAALLAAGGGMGVLGNWERPSSFSLLVRYPDREIAMVVAGILFVGSVLVITRLAEVHGRRAVYLSAGTGGLVAALAWGIVRTGGDPAALLVTSKALPYLAAGGLMLALTVELTRRAGAQVAGTAYLVAPSLLTTLLFVEQATGVFGPRPILLDAVAWATVAVAAALVLVHGPSRPVASSPLVASRWLPVAGRALGVLAVAIAFVGLVSPGVSAAVNGTTADGQAFSARFALSGVSTVGGWVALALALLALGAWFTAPGRVAAWVTAVSGAVGAIAYLGVRYTPLHTWISWIPPEVQHDYGTEYANIVFEPVPVGAQTIAVIVGCVALVALAVWRTTPAGSQNPSGS